jgi:tRNA uracil 4-sulfurtransferase
MQCILIKANEIFLKSDRTRPAFERRFVSTVREALARKHLQVQKLENLGNLYVLECEDYDLALEVLSHVPGLDQFALCDRLTFSSLDDLVTQSLPLTQTLVKNKIFCVRAKKKKGEFAFSSRDAEFALGSKLYSLGKGVDLEHPQVCITLELRDDTCFLYWDLRQGIGGILTGSHKRLLCMFSGGMDSPVAAIEFLRKGCQVDFLFVNIIGEKNLQDVSSVYNYLISEFVFSYTPRLYVVDASSLSEKLRSEIPDNLRQVALKSALYGIASSVCEKEGYDGLISGESIGQKSSQTLENLFFLDRFLTKPILRPLLCFDKVEIMEKAHKYGTYALSEKVKEVCNLSKGPVVTQMVEGDIQKIPSFVSFFPSLLSTIFVHEGAIRIEEQEAAPTHSLIVVDMRMEPADDIKAIITLPYPAVLKKMDVFEVGKNYLLVCEYGVRSAELAFSLRKKGIAVAGIALEKYKKYFLKK